MRIEMALSADCGFLQLQVGRIAHTYSIYLYVLYKYSIQPCLVIDPTEFADGVPSSSVLRMMRHFKHFFRSFRVIDECRMLLSRCFQARLHLIYIARATLKLHILNQLFSTFIVLIDINLLLLLVRLLYFSIL